MGGVIVAGGDLRLAADELEDGGRPRGHGIIVVGKAVEVSVTWGALSAGRNVALVSVRVSRCWNAVSGVRAWVLIRRPTR